MKILTVAKPARGFRVFAGATFELRTLLNDGQHFIHPTTMGHGESKGYGMAVSNELLHSQDAIERPYPSEYVDATYTRQLLTLMQASVGAADTRMMLVPQAKRETTPEDDESVLISLIDNTAKIDNAFGKVFELMPRFIRIGRGSALSVRTRASKGRLGLGSENKFFNIRFDTAESYSLLAANDREADTLLINDLSTPPCEALDFLQGRRITWA